MPRFPLAALFDKDFDRRTTPAGARPRRPSEAIPAQDHSGQGARAFASTSNRVARALRAPPTCESAVLHCAEGSVSHSRILVASDDQENVFSLSNDPVRQS